jgi:hypothetical protein
LIFFEGFLPRITQLGVTGKINGPLSGAHAGFGEEGPQIPAQRQTAIQHCCKESSMRIVIRVLSYAILLPSLILPVAWAQTGGTLGDIVQKLRQQPVTWAKTTDDHKDLTAAGTVLVLHKDRFLMYPTAAVAPALNIYKDGTLKSGGWREIEVIAHLDESGLTNQTLRKYFEAGEKFFITGADVEPDGVTLTLYSDPYDNVRYYGQLKIPFPKHVIPSPDEVLQQIHEVLTIDTSSPPAPAVAAAPAPAPAATAPPAPPAAAAQSSVVKPLPLPPPPPAQPKTVAIGQSEDQVVATLGEPATVIDKKAAGKIFIYKDLKVIFKAGKVADIE